MIGDLPDKNSKNFLNSYYLYLLKNKIIIARDLIRSNKKYAKIYNLDESQVIFDKKDKINNLFFLPVDIDTTRIFYNLINLNENIKLSLLSQRPNLPFINRKDILIYFY